MIQLPIEIGKLKFGVGRPEEWEKWGKFLRTYEGEVEQLPKWGTLWSLKLLYEDIRENGTANPSIVDDDWKVLVGNQRLCVQLALGYKFVECFMKETVVEDLNWARKQYQDTHYDRVRKSP